MASNLVRRIPFVALALVLIVALSHLLGLLSGNGETVERSQHVNIISDDTLAAQVVSQDPLSAAAVGTIGSSEADAGGLDQVFAESSKIEAEEGEAGPSISSALGKAPLDSASGEDHVSSASLQTGSAEPKPLTEETKSFWKAFSDVLSRSRPSFDEVRRKPGDCPLLDFGRHDERNVRPDLIDLSDDEFAELRSKRADTIEELRPLASRMPFTPGTKGIVTTAPQNAFAILTTSLWMLRSSGSRLPVEIWLYDHSEYEEEPCDVIFPSFSAKCMYMVDFLPEGLELAHVKFTYKPLATVFSSFEQILFLDDDVFPVVNPDNIFDTEPFLSKGMVLWPDFWADTAAFDLYDLGGLEPPNLKQRASTESGQLMVNKASHGAVLLLSTWFNTRGPRYWHRLASQGCPGEGDKDLWRFSAMAFDLPWYQVEERPQRIGYRCGEDGIPIATAQSHPRDDFVIVNASLVRDKKTMLSLGTSTHPRILFIHANFPKLDPYLLLDWGTITAQMLDVLNCDKGTGAPHRLYGPPELTIPKYGWDMERAIWEAFVWMACEHEKAYSVWTTWSFWRTNPRNDLCSAVQTLWDERFPGQSWSRTVPDPEKQGVERPWGQHDWG